MTFKIYHFLRVEEENYFHYTVAVVVPTSSKELIVDPKEGNLNSIFCFTPAVTLVILHHVKSLCSKEERGAGTGHA